MVAPNVVMKFHNFDVFYQICYIFDLSSALACCVESINIIIIINLQNEIKYSCTM